MKGGICRQPGGIFMESEPREGRGAPSRDAQEEALGPGRVTRESMWQEARKQVVRLEPHVGTGAQRR